MGERECGDNVYIPPDGTARQPGSIPESATCPVHPETGTTMPQKGTIQPPNGDKGASITPADIRDPIDGEYNALPDDAALRDVDNNLPDVEVRPGKDPPNCAAKWR